jgi:2-oxoglutarate dehydrogenase E1 component
MGVEQFVMGMAHRGRLNILANIFGKSTQDIFGEFEGKITIKNILTVMLSIT